MGENMERVVDYAKQIGGQYYRPWKNEPHDLALGLRRNLRWIRDQRRNGRQFIDIGPDFRRRAIGKISPYYELERMDLRVSNYLNYQKVFVRNKSEGGVPGLDF
jgi:hypothetical protein